MSRRRARPVGRSAALGALLHAVGLACLAWLTSCAPAPELPVAIGERLPGFALSTLDGDLVELDALAGDGPILINFWATWCGPCVREVPALQRLHERGVRVVSINIDDGNRGPSGEETVRSFVERHGVTFPVLLGSLGDLRRHGGYGIPYTLVLDEELRLRDVFRSLVSERALARALRSAEAPLELSSGAASWSSERSA